MALRFVNGKLKQVASRPEVCRDGVIAPGNPACLATRNHFRIPLPLA